jgi:CBS-domain-containing membrane protein
MTADVLTVSPDTSVRTIAALLLEHRISAVPVIDASGRVVGIVSEGDLMHRAETGTERPRSRWFELFSDTKDLAREFVKSHGLRAADVMTRPVVSVAEDVHVAEVARLFGARRIKRVPVLREGRLVGILSRADLLRGLARARNESAPADDGLLRETILNRLRAAPWARGEMVNVVVDGGAVELLGFADSREQKQAIRALAENVAGTHVVHDRLQILPRLYAA